MKTVIFLFLMAVGLKAYAFETDPSLERLRMFDEAESAVENSKFTRTEVESNNKKKIYRDIASEKKDKWFQDMEGLMPSDEELDNEKDYK